jgi:hypothetical protein
VAQQGSPPRRSSRRPESGRAGRHGSREQPAIPGPDPRDDWGTRPGRADAGQRAAPAQRESRPARPDREAWRQHDPFTADDEADAPPWAGPSIHATGPGGSRLRPPAQGPDEPEPRPGVGRRRGRADATRLRRSQRRVYLWCGTAIAVAVIVAVVAAIHGLRKPAPASPFVTTLQAGEYRTVPSACGSVSPALLSQYLPGARRVTPAGSGTGTSQCTFTVDSKPMFRVLQVTAQAYQPSAVAAGNGSATANATGAFLLAQQQLAHPGKKSPLPAAQVTPLTGLGKQAFSAVQVIRAGKAVTNLVTILVRDRNVVVSVSLQAQASGQGFGPVSVATVQAGALAVGRVVVAKAAAEPVVHG